MKPRTEADAFDLSTPEVQGWEVEWIQEALVRDEIEVTVHALERQGGRAVSYRQIYRTVFNPEKVSKDLPNNAQQRTVGLNFSRHLEGESTLHVKVGFRDGYAVITVFWG